MLRQVRKITNDDRKNDTYMGYWHKMDLNRNILEIRVT